ncbi:hypothetical protein T265_06566 [Opisthorchis viverrini]|uniref:Coatomer subunit epsilon n=1 Tax=Opisthorchis viverrini TaxID=6198 RepID=A0A074ZFM9_OPIVI|nr:hypothetical protein T265_06566 [Opisthorchis viverrini]KER26086.1 hypothetical protein T265_06566 [Opisthorchis viverrini]
MVAGADLFDAHHAYLLGNFQHALRILQKIKVKSSWRYFIILQDKELQLKVDVLTYRVYLAQKKYGVVLDEIREDSEHIELRFIRLLASFFTSTNAKERVLREAEKLLTGTLGEDAELVLVLAATLYLNADLPELALKTLHPGEGVYWLVLDKKEATTGEGLSSSLPQSFGEAHFQTLIQVIWIETANRNAIDIHRQLYLAASPIRCSSGAKHTLRCKFPWHNRTLASPLLVTSPPTPVPTSYGSETTDVEDRKASRSRCWNRPTFTSIQKNSPYCSLIHTPFGNQGYTALTP